MPVVDVTAADVREQEVLQRNQERVEAELRARHENELQVLQEKADRELKEQEQAALEAFNMKKQQVGSILISLCF